MAKFYLGATTKTPLISLDPEQGSFELRGRSIPENSIEFYNPLLDYLDNLHEAPPHALNMEMNLEYFNTSSSKCLVEIFRRLERLYNSGSTVEINWYYDEEDEDMLESGADFSAIIKIPIKMVKVAEEED